jgi:hypothetical protein
MKNTELRIGNFLKGKNSHVIVKSILQDGHIKIYGNKSFFIVEGITPCLKPIPLTEEWLVKFGFKAIDTYDDNHYYLESINLCLDRSFQPFGIGEYTLTFEYVHQLQNLYHALTGEELTIKT